MPQNGTGLHPFILTCPIIFARLERKTVKTSDFDYYLPPELIAQTPIEPRDSSRLLVLDRASGLFEHRRFYDILDYVEVGDVIVLNESRVIPARLRGRRKSGGSVEVLLLRRLEPCLWQALVRPSRRIAPGETVLVAETMGGSNGSVEVQVLDRCPEGVRTVRLADETLLQASGETPLPPYIHTPLQDPGRYQTIYAQVEGSVAAPTAGLHFTPELLQRIEHKGASLAKVTLHIGLDTFRPVACEDVSEHHIHSEYAEITEDVAAELRQGRAEGRRVICIGTTTVRLLEQAAHVTSNPAAYRGEASIFILPGHDFKCVDAMVTNFHLPRSTLLMLVYAFAGSEMAKRAYQEAIAERYRFYSFGDAMLIL